MPAQRDRLSYNSSHERGHEREYVTWLRLPIDVHLKAVTLESKTYHFPQVVEGILHVDILGTLLLPILIEIEHLADVSPLANFFHQQFCLNRPATKGGAIVTYLKYLNRRHYFYRGIERIPRSAIYG